MMLHGVNFDHVRIAEICKTHGVKRLAVFGSVLRDDFTPESDIDVLVDFEEGRGDWFADQFPLQEALQAFWGREVDVIDRRGLHPMLKDYVQRVAWVQYAA